MRDTLRGLGFVLRGTFRLNFCGFKDAVVAETTFGESLSVVAKGVREWV